MAKEMILKDLRAENRSRVFQQIRKDGEASSPALSKILNLSRPTVTQNLNELLHAGVIYESGLQATNGGRRAKTYAVVKNSHCAVGADITKNHVTIIIINFCGETIYQRRARQKFSWDEEFRQKFCQLVMEAVQESGLQDEQILGVGISLPALVTEDGQHVFYGKILGITGMEASYFEQGLPYPVRLFNDANAAGYAEVSVRPEIGDSFYISLSNNIGGSILIDHKVYRGQTSHSGEIGHMTIHPDGRDCYCGQHGCLETYCNATILDEGFDGDLAAYFEALQAGDAKCQQIWQEYCQNLALAVNNVHMLFDATVILGGYVGAYIEPYMKEIRQLVAKRSPFSEDTSYLLACKVKKNALAFGSALDFLHEAWRNI